MGNNMKNELVICIPTFQNPIYIEEMLEKYIGLFSELEISVILADSSSDRTIQSIYEKHIQSNDNIYYQKYPSEISSNEKVYLELKRVSEETDFQYVWVCSDAVRFDELLLRGVCGAIKSQPDVVALCRHEYSANGIYYTNDIQFFFETYNYDMTLYGAFILNCHRMIISAPWSEYYNKYIFGLGSNYSHVAFLFEQLVRVNNPRILIMDLPKGMLRVSGKKRYSSWEEDAYNVVFIGWYNMIKELPREYNKEKAFSGCYFEEAVSRMPEWMANGQITNEQYKEGRFLFEDILGVKYDFKQKRLINEEELFRQYRELEDFCKKTKRKVMYGTGRIAHRYIRVFGIERLGIEAFIVSGQESEGDYYFYGLPIYGVEDFGWDEDVSIILALNIDNTLQVLETIKNRGICFDNIFTYPQINHVYASGFERKLKEII